jgi:hypothetical protein
MYKSAAYILFFSFAFLPAGCGGGRDIGKGVNPMGQITWDINNTKSIAGLKTTVSGSPKVIEADKGKAVEFDGVKDGLAVESLPLAGAKKFTLEIIFRPGINGLAAQRFLHLQENNSESRILIETRLPDGKNWYLDTYINSPAGDHTLVEPANIHPVGQWYNATLVYDGETMHHYVNGVEEMSAKLAFSPLGEGKTSIGVRINQVHWFKGTIKRIRFTPEVLTADNFMKP